MVRARHQKTAAARHPCVCFRPAHNSSTLPVPNVIFLPHRPFCSFHQSGTHWLASVLSQIYAPWWSPDVDATAAAGETAAARHMASMNPRVRFHGFPVFWLLTRGQPGDPAIPAAVFDAVEAVPWDTPRIFLSHMPVEHFEYEPAPGTKIVYLVREPREVWTSLLNFMSRRKMATNGLTGFLADDVVKITYDFVNGNVPLPPRFRERGAEFSWSAHVRGWWQRLKGGDNSGAMVDFGAAMADPIAAVEQLLRYCRGNSTTCNDSSSSSSNAHHEAGVIAAGASRENMSRVFLSIHDHPTMAEEAEYHFPPQQQQQPWTADYPALPFEMQRLFT
jgi:hypothetical protein